mmetsp:Transcript_39390/g.83278  ORF Transcript_39390/g.83278 Transcript_39390/m.83278 type:complete len:142 (+) Transcript_39390:121-546(+)
MDAVERCTATWILLKFAAAADIGVLMIYWGASRPQRFTIEGKIDNSFRVVANVDFEEHKTRPWLRSVQDTFGWLDEVRLTAVHKLSGVRIKVRDAPLPFGGVSIREVAVIRAWRAGWRRQDRGHEWGADVAAGRLLFARSF